MPARSMARRHPSPPAVRWWPRKSMATGLPARRRLAKRAASRKWAARSTGTARKWSPARASTPPASRTAT
ncbi:hypothetical protein G6F50_018631 [Rhizopus delemar]|uniref:Uncharacterized protein n=1 Tax=Rhizopus delemar TaxID=936053 RepID=A0A9P6XLQ5_9FUNG|nr:hypothetical protein G6F50_018631 [Rhizopus delemar]